jgi:hypothetical protein
LKASFVLLEEAVFGLTSVPISKNMRSTLYWLTSSAIAALSMHAVAGTSDMESSMMIGQIMVDPSGVSEASKAILLGIGIMAVAYTYRCAWENHHTR